MKLTRWWFWPALAALSAAYIGAGLLGQDTNARLITDTYDVFIVALPCSALLFIVVYTVLGFMGAAKWWLTDFGNRLVLLPYSVLVATSELAWAQLFHHGLLNTPLESWIYLGGIIQGALVLLWSIPLWIRAFREGNGRRDGLIRATLALLWRAVSRVRAFRDGNGNGHQDGRTRAPGASTRDKEVTP